jgi:hypothetical protein
MQIMQARAAPAVAVQQMQQALQPGGLAIHLLQAHLREAVVEETVDILDLPFPQVVVVELML